MEYTFHFYVVFSAAFISFILIQANVMTAIVGHINPFSVYPRICPGSIAFPFNAPYCMHMLT
jgi:hypothetical protein